MIKLDNFPDYIFYKVIDNYTLYNLVLLKNDDICGVTSIENPEFKNITYYTKFKIDKPKVYLETGLVKIHEDCSDKKLLIKTAKEEINSSEWLKSIKGRFFIITGIMNTDKTHLILRQNYNCSMCKICYYKKCNYTENIITSRKICIPIFYRLLEVK